MATLGTISPPVGKIMGEEEMLIFIEKVGRTELFDEIKDISSNVYALVRPNHPHPYPRYLKAIRVTLVSLGYDPAWVDGTFRDALEARYYR